MKISEKYFKNITAGIYCIEHVDTKKKYIGSSKNVYNRLHKHRTLLVKSKHENIKLQNAVNKYSIDKFICYLLEVCSEEKLTIREQHWIDVLKPEYNITLEVIRNILSEESRIKISSTLKERYDNGSITPVRVTKVDVYSFKGEFIKTFNSITECSKELNIHPTSIIRVMKKEYAQAKGYIFVNHNEDLIINKDFCETNKTSRAKAKDKVYYTRKVTVIDLVNNKELEFNSLKEAAQVLNIQYQVLLHIVNKSKKKTYKQKYKFITCPRIKQGELLETPTI